MRKFQALSIAVLLLAACGDDSNSAPLSIEKSNNANNTNNANNETTGLALACDDSETPVGLEGSVYVDVEDKANSLYTQADVREPVPGVPVRLRSEGGEEWQTTTCDDGSFRFGELGSQMYVIDAQIEGVAATTNDLKNVYDSIANDDLNLIVFGDSIPVFGPTPWFPNVLQDKLAPLATVEMQNVAVSGTTSPEWLPGTGYFIQNLLPTVKDADVIVFSLGGNDVLGFIAGLQSDPNPAARLGEIQPLIEEIVANINAIVDRIKLTNPDVDVMWIVYPNYAVTDQWKGFLGNYANAAIPLVEDLLQDVRTALSDRDDLVLIDMLEATRDVDLDSLIIDQLHLNVDGHRFYASEVARTMGVIEADVTPIRYDFGIKP